MFRRRPRGFEKRPGGGGNAVTLHELLGPSLGTFQLGRRPRGSENTKPAAGEKIHKPPRQRGLGTDHDEFDAFGFAKTPDIRKVVLCDFPVVRRATVARQAEDVFGAGVLRQFPGQGVFAAAATDDRDFHFANSFLATAKTSRQTRAARPT